MKPTKIKIEKEIKEITLHPSEYITIWLDFGGPEKIQVELRVTPKGKPEIFCDGISSLSWYSWYII